MSTDLELQIKVSKMLGLGFVYSIFPIGGMGSLAALVLGLKARRIIGESGGVIAGMRMAWWCIVIGGLGAIILPISITISLIILSHKK